MRDFFLWSWSEREEINSEGRSQGVGVSIFAREAGYNGSVFLAG